MKMSALAILPGCVILALSSTSAVAQEGLRDGLYEVKVTLDMGVSEDLSARKTARVCLKSDAPGGAYGLFLMTDNVQLSKCPVRHAARRSGSLTFDIICDGIDAGQASAVYTLTNDAFEGRIAMRMGGKNMTMREAQSGKRVGDCP